MGHSTKRLKTTDQSKGAMARTWSGQRFCAAQFRFLL